MKTPVNWNGAIILLSLAVTPLVDNLFVILGCSLVSAKPDTEKHPFLNDLKYLISDCGEIS